VTRRRASASGCPRGRPSAPTNYDAEAFVEGLKARGIEPHVAINGTVSKNGVARKTAVPPEVAASLGYAISQRLRKRIEESLGWSKTVGGLAQVKVRGLAKVRAVFRSKIIADFPALRGSRESLAEFSHSLRG
jgi:hypothetical protein